MAHSTVEKTWQAHGLDCAVLLMDMGHRCGYCRVPESHPWFKLDYDQEDAQSRQISGCVEVHGGLTFSGLRSGDLPVGWWFGFDCAHAYDTPEDWTLEAVAAEVERMAEQVAGFAKEPA
jgi:hypothetical protein